MKKAMPHALPDLALLHREITQLFARLSELDRASAGVEGTWCPPVDVFECRGRLVITLEVPGFAPESLRVLKVSRDIVVSGERRERRPGPGAVGFVCLERPQGRFERRVPLDVAVDVSGAEAHLSRGLLTITLPRVKDRRGREIEIPVRREPEE